MLKEASITLPRFVDPRREYPDESARLRAEQEHDAALDALRKRILKTWGGYTETSGNGAWLSPEGDIVTEPVVILTFAVPAGINDQPGPTDHDIGMLAAAACVSLDQQAVYYRYPDGEVVILERETAEALHGARAAGEQ